jgi:hypothetical protein
MKPEKPMFHAIGIVMQGFVPPRAASELDISDAIP